MPSAERMSSIKLSVYWSEITDCPVVQIDTDGLTEELRVDLNDGAIWLGDPEIESPRGAFARAQRDNRIETPDQPESTLQQMAEVLNRIAIGLGSQEEWGSDELEWIAEAIGTVLPHPGDQASPEGYTARAQEVYRQAVAQNESRKQ